MKIEFINFLGLYDIKGVRKRDREEVINSIYIYIYRRMLYYLLFGIKESLVFPGSNEISTILWKNEDCMDRKATVEIDPVGG